MPGPEKLNNRLGKESLEIIYICKDTFGHVHEEATVFLIFSNEFKIPEI